MSILFNSLNIDYQKPDSKNWKGRKTNSNNNDLYWYQNVRFGNSDKFPTYAISIIGYGCEEGVLRNQGRVGTQEAPDKIRQQLAKFSFHHKKVITDFGNLVCIKNDMEDCQIALSEFVYKSILNNNLPIVLGGGHDVAFGNFMGIKKAVSQQKKQRIGIVNFDAHFDLRKIEEKPNSGTPFYQICEELKKEDKPLNYFTIGIHPSSNTKELYNTAITNGVNFIEIFECDTFSEAIKTQLVSFVENIDHIYITIDLDGFSSAFAPGVSAPSPVGLYPNFVFKALDYLFSTKKVISCDVAELNPKFDIDNRTANLAAKLIDFMISRA